MSVHCCFKIQHPLAVSMKSYWWSTASKDAIYRCSVWAQFSPHHNKVIDEVSPFFIIHSENENKSLRDIYPYIRFFFLNDRFHSSDSGFCLLQYITSVKL